MTAKQTVTRTVEPFNLTASEWQIYSSEKGSAAAARRLNKSIARAMSVGTAEEAYPRVWKALVAESEYGAADSEPRGVAASLMKEVFGPRSDNWPHYEYI